jgi:ABC-2 type transport system ATP-binding protein
MLLEAESLTKDYGPIRALDSLTLGLGPGQIFGLLGPNGSGKSTALRLILGFLQPTAGRATVDGRDCWRESVAVRRRVAYLPGELRLYENMTGRQLLRFLGRLRGHEVAGRTDRLASQFDIDLDRPLSQMSSGMKRKVALLQVLVPNVPLLILDEPTNTLDPTMRDQLLGQLQKARDDGQAVLFSSHVLTEVEQVCDRVGILQGGRLVHLQAMAELREARLIRVDFRGPSPTPPPMAGLTVREHHNHRLVLEFTGALPPVLDWLARQPIADLRMGPLGLGPIYRRYHGAQV